jgi:phosphoesterase RecJ-like protein
MERLQVSPDDTEGLVDVLRSMDGVEVACLFQKEPDQVRLSLRSSSPEWPVVEIAEQLGGGGHVMAAGARIPGAGVPQAVAAFRELTQKVFGR